MRYFFPSQDSLSVNLVRSFPLLRPIFTYQALMVKYRLYKIVDKESLEQGEIPGEFLEKSIHHF